MVIFTSLFAGPLFLHSDTDRVTVTLQ